MADEQTRERHRKHVDGCLGCEAIEAAKRVRCACGYDGPAVGVTCPSCGADPGGEVEKPADLVGGVAMSFEVPRRLLEGLLCTAIEGGSTYWAHFSGADRSPAFDYLAVRVREAEAHGAGPALDRRVSVDDLAVGLSRLAAASMAWAEGASKERPGGVKGFETAGTHLGDALSENGDATTADVVLQMALFGDVVYG